MQRSSTEVSPSRKKLLPLDTLRLEILYNGTKELYASPGARNFGEEGATSFISTGMMGDGVFAAHVHSIFVSDGALITYRGEDIAGRDRGWARAVKYDYRIPRMQSGWSVKVSGGSGIVGEKGSFWADPETFELLRFEVYADDIPSSLPVSEVSIMSNFARMRIGDADIMLPQNAEMRMLQLGGEESVNQFEFTHCRSYRAESSISFETADAPIAKPEAPSAAPAPLPPAAPAAIVPAGLIVPVTLTTALDNDSAVGALLEGRISADVPLKGKVLIPQGASIHGRIRRLERYTDSGGYFVVGLEFTEVQAGFSVLRFYADLQSASGVPGLEWLISTSTSHNFEGGSQTFTHTIKLPDLPGVGSFFIKGARFSVPAGFRMQWKTRAIGN